MKGTNTCLTSCRDGQDHSILYNALFYTKLKAKTVVIVYQDFVLDIKKLKQWPPTRIRLIIANP